MNELVKALQSRIADLEREKESLRKPLLGISTCATSCGCCAMHRRIAQSALDELEHPAE